MPVSILTAQQRLRYGRFDLQQLRAAPGEPSERNLNRLLDNIKYMHELGIGKIDLSHLPVARRQEFVKDAMRMSPADLRDLNKPRRVAMVICLLVDLRVSHQNYAPQMHQRLLKESRARAEGKRRKSVIGRLGDIFGYLRMLAEIFRIVRDPALSANAKINKIIALTTGPDNIDAIIKDCDDIAKPEADSHISHLSNKYSYPRRFSVRFLEVMELAAADASSSAQKVIQAIIHLRAVDNGERDFADNPPLDFLPTKLTPEVQRTDGTVDRRAWEMALHERMAEEIQQGQDRAILRNA